MNDSFTPLPGHIPQPGRIPPPGRALASSSNPVAHDQPVSRFQRATDALRMAMPLVQRLLPLLDGNVGSAVSNLLNPHPPAPPPEPPVNLAPLEDGLAELQAGHRDLRGQVLQQSESLKRVEELLELVSEAADRHALAQQEQMDELKAVGNQLAALKAAGRQANLFARVALALLTVSILLNVLLLLRFHRILP